MKPSHRAFFQAIEGLRALHENPEKRQQLIREVCENLGIREGATMTKEQRQQFIEALSHRVMRGKRIYDGDGVRIQGASEDRRGTRS